MKRKYREAMRAAKRERDMQMEYAADVLQGYEENAQRRTLWPPMPAKPAGGEPWRPVITEQERAERERQIANGAIPF
jgi:hypothetical protein